MMTIWKYTLDRMRRVTTLDIPSDAVLLTVQMQASTPTLWFELDPTNPKMQRNFAIYGTGWEINPGAYVGSCQDGAFVWHVYELARAQL